MKFAHYASGGNYQTYKTVKKAVIMKISSQVDNYLMDIVTSMEDLEYVNLNAEKPTRTATGEPDIVATDNKVAKQKKIM